MGVVIAGQRVPTRQSPGGTASDFLCVVKAVKPRVRSAPMCKGSVGERCNSSFYKLPSCPCA